MLDPVGSLAVRNRSYANTLRSCRRELLGGWFPQRPSPANLCLVKKACARKIRARDASTPPPPSIRWVPAPPRLEHRTGCLDSQCDWLTVERLPAYAPELNAVEYLWANLKDVELANLPTTTLAEVADATEQGIQRICKSDSLVVGFLAHTGLTLDP